MNQSRLDRNLPYIEFAVAIIAASLWYFQGGAVWYTGAFPGAWPIVLLAAAWLLRWRINGFKVHFNLIDVLLIAFVITALIGVWAAYDPGPAWAKFFLIVGAIGLYYAIAHQPDRDRLFVVLVFFGIFGVALALYFGVTNDWSAQATKFSFLVSVGQRLSVLLPALSSHQLHPNVAGGLLAFVLPLYVPLFILSRQRRKQQPQAKVWRWLPWLWIGAALLVLLAVLVTESRGAWLALAITGSMWGVWRGLGWLLRRREPDRSFTLKVLITSGVWLLGIIGGLILIGFLLNREAAGFDSLSSRVGLVRDGLLLSRDYALTGLGLGMFELQYSTYILLIHVPPMVHTHNLFINLLLEQGLLGLSAYLFFSAASMLVALRILRHAAHEAARLVEAAIAMQCVIWIHGLMDDALYGSRGLLLLFVPMAIVAAAAQQQSQPLVERWRSTPFTKRALAIATLVLIMVSIIWWRPVAAAVLANLGAVDQSRVELSHYDPARFAQPTLDEIRQTENLDQAIGWFEQARLVDPANSTAAQRLAAIDLSRGQYRAALDPIQAAWVAGHQDSVTRLLLGDALVANGRVSEAAQVLRNLQRAIGRLEFQAFYRYAAAKDYRRAADAWAAVVALDPTDQSAINAQAEAARKAEQK